MYDYKELCGNIKNFPAGDVYATITSKDNTIEYEDACQLLEMIKANEERKAILSKYNEPKKCADGYYSVSVYEPKTNKRVQIRRRDLKDIQEAIIDFDLKHCSLTIGDAYRTYVEKSALISEATKLRNDQQYRRFLQSWEDRCIKDISFADITDLSNEILLKGCKKKAYYAFTTLIKAIFDSANDFCGVDTIDIRRALEIAKRTNNKNGAKFEDAIKTAGTVADTDSVFGKAEMDKYISYCIGSGKLIDLGIALLFYSGLRIGELVVLKRDSFSADYRTIYVRHSCSVVNGKCSVGLPKMRKYRDVYLPDVGVEIVKMIFDKMDEKSEYLFYDSKCKNQYYTPHRFYERIKRIDTLLDISSMPSAHDIRRTYDSCLSEKGVPDAVRMNLMGHELKGIDGHYIRDISTPDDKIKLLNNAFPLSA